MRAGEVQRIRGGWLATASADGPLRRAAGVSGRLTCVSATAQHGLWTPTSRHGHVAVAHSASRFDRRGLVVHWARGPMPTRPGDLVDPIENVLFHVARCRPRADALAVWESALRTGMPLDYLRGIRWRSSAADALLDAITPASDSGLETIFFALLAPYGLPLRQQVVIAGRPVDGLIGDRLVLQVDGFAFHADAAQRRSDIRHDAALRLMGYTVLRFDYAQIMSDADAVCRTILGAVAQGLHLDHTVRRRSPASRAG